MNVRVVFLKMNTAQLILLFVLKAKISVLMYLSWKICLVIPEGQVISYLLVFAPSNKCFLNQFNLYTFLQNQKFTIKLWFENYFIVHSLL